MARFGPSKRKTALKMGRFGNGSKMGQTPIFPKVILDLWHIQLKRARFERSLSHFGPPKVPKSLENGLLGDQKLVKNGQNPVFLILIQAKCG